MRWQRRAVARGKTQSERRRRESRRVIQPDAVTGEHDARLRVDGRAVRITHDDLPLPRLCISRAPRYEKRCAQRQNEAGKRPRGHGIH